MDEAVEVMRAILRGHCRSDAEAERVIAAARRLQVDPIDYCIHRYGLGAEKALQRAAEWAGLAFSPVVPDTGGSAIEVSRIDRLAGVRSIRKRLFDREVLYVAPRLENLIRLKAHATEHPAARRSTCITPAHAIRTALVELTGPQLLAEARQRLSRRWPFASAHLDLGRGARIAFVALLAALSTLTLLGPLMLQAILLPLVGVMLMAPALFRLLAALWPPEAVHADAPPLSDGELPDYSVLIPLCDEARMVPLLDRAMRAIDYPPEKLDIKFVVEERSASTVAAVRRLLGDARFELIVVPHAAPFTKPKALDFALPFVRGAHVVVYDAEDIPNPDQLRLAAAAFAADPGLDCLQAELLVDNARETALTGLFTAEYAGQFGVVMPALAAWRLPVPLGGTSNHFRTTSLRELGGWDAFNVTEDADLGVRLARLRYRTAMLSSQTYEEAPISLSAWMNQRTRWMKGWMQTFIVHNRHPVALVRDMGWRGCLAFEVYVGSMIVSPLLHTLFVGGLILALVTGRGFAIDFGNPQSLIAVPIFLVGYGSSFAVAVAGLLRLGQRRLLAQQLLLPLYWILHALATMRAAYQLLTRPHFWAKTPHGLTRLRRSFSAASRPPEVAATRRVVERTR